MNEVICEFCNSTLSSKYILRVHLVNNKACLAIRNMDFKTTHLCRGCNRYNTCAQKLSVHHDICKEYQCLILKEEHEKKIKEIEINYKKEKEELNQEIEEKEKEIKNIKEENEKEIKDLETIFKKEKNYKDEKIKDLKTQLDKMFSTIETLAKQAIDKPNIVNNIESFEKEKDESIPISVKDQMSSIFIEEIKEDDYSMISLNNVTITSRPIDHYVNATQLCQAGGKKFSHWFSLDTTKELIKELSADAGITASGLVETNKGENNKTDQISWIHPDLSISLAQWISPKFSIQVSKWVRTLFNKGSLEIDLSILREKNERIKKLENVCLSKQRRVEYPEKNVIYLLTTDDHLKRRTYIIGKAKNLTNRLGTYNKTCDHTVIYYKECKNEEDMDISEIMVLSKLRDYREQANRDRFILPQDKDISFFIGTIDDCIHFLK